MTHMTIGDDTFEVRVEGDTTKPSLLLSNSLGTDHSLWDGQIAALTDHFRVIRYDTRGHGGSPLGAGPVSIGRLGRDALSILDALEIEKTHILGLSLGGLVAQWLLIHAADRIERVVLANTAARIGQPDGWNQRIENVLANGMNEIAATTIERWFSTTFQSEAPDAVSVIHESLLAMDAASYAVCCAAIRDTDMRESLRKADRPVLVITGREDPVITGEETAILLGSMDGAQHIELDARHLSNIEAKDAFNATIIGFLTAKAPLRRTAELKTVATRKTPARKTAVRERPRTLAARSRVKTVATPNKTTAKTLPLKKTAAARRKPVAVPPVGAHAKATRPKAEATRSAVAKTKAIPIGKAAANKNAKAPPSRRPTATSRTGQTSTRVAARPSKARTSVTKATIAKKAPAKKTVAKKVVTRKVVAKTAPKKTAAPKTAISKTTVAKKGKPIKTTSKKSPAKANVTKASPIARRKPAPRPSPRKRTR